VLAPIVTGYVIASIGSYDFAFVIAGLLLIVGATVCFTMTRQPIAADASIAAGAAAMAE
jgi:ACS family glucarate transporter-like MFS transporter